MSYSVEDIIELVRYHIVLGDDGGTRAPGQLCALVDAIDEMRTAMLADGMVGS